jgi:hypothetical protein
MPSACRNHYTKHDSLSTKLYKRSACALNIRSKINGIEVWAFKNYDEYTLYRIKAFGRYVDGNLMMNDRVSSFTINIAAAIHHFHLSGNIFPGFNIPFGSKVVLIPRIN